MTLRDRLVRQLGDVELVQKVDQICVSCLGAEWKNCAARQFDLEVAAGSLRCFRVDSLPRLPRQLPAGVVDLRALLDLSKRDSVPLESLRLKEGLFANL